MPKNQVIVDAHSHIYPDPIAQKAAANVGEFYGVEMASDGRVSSYLKQREAAGIRYSIAYSVALKPDNVVRINDFIAKAAATDPTLIGFAAMHQDCESLAAEVERCIAMGLKGFKIHPDSQRVNVDDPRLMRLYELIEGRLPITVHAGDYRYDYSHPRRIREVLHAFPQLTMNAAHFGGWSIYDLAVEYLEDERCFMDLSSAAVWLGRRRTRELIELYGPERILFGSDSPMFDPQDELERFFANELDARSSELILHRNAECFLGCDLEL
ncbi:MAG: amidohydrolase [Actinomycetia bacterium]|nr:amidohydrolase [Actinomycetes bacterium]